MITAAGDYRFRISAEEPAIDINLVGGEIDYRPAAQSFVPPPVPELLHILEAVLLERRRIISAFFGQPASAVIGDFP